LSAFKIRADIIDDGSRKLKAREKMRRNT